MYALFAETLGTCVHYHDEYSIDNTFFTNHYSNQVMKWDLGICKICQFISLQENINFQFVPLLLHNTSCLMTVFSGAPLKRMTGEDDRNKQIFFSPELDNNVYQVLHL